jgi:hypothetical protein
MTALSSGVFTNTPRVSSRLPAVAGAQARDLPPAAASHKLKSVFRGIGEIPLPLSRFWDDIALGRKPLACDAAETQARGLRHFQLSTNGQEVEGIARSELRGVKQRRAGKETTCT